MVAVDPGNSFATEWCFNGCSVCLSILLATLTFWVLKSVLIIPWLRAVLYQWWSYESSDIVSISVSCHGVVPFLVYVKVGWTMCLATVNYQEQLVVQLLHGWKDCANNPRCMEAENYLMYYGDNSVLMLDQRCKHSNGRRWNDWSGQKAAYKMDVGWS